MPSDRCSSAPSSAFFPFGQSRSRRNGGIGIGIGIRRGRDVGFEGCSSVVRVVGIRLGRSGGRNGVCVEGGGFEFGCCVCV